MVERSRFDPPCKLPGPKPPEGPPRPPRPPEPPELLRPAVTPPRHP